jgi:hypothetical protein
MKDKKDKYLLVTSSGILIIKKRKNMRSLVKAAAYLLVIALSLNATVNDTLRKAKNPSLVKHKLSTGDSITLVWSPIDSVDKGFLGQIEKSNRELMVKSVIDNRPAGAVLGKCIGRKDVKVIYAKGDFASWIQQNIERYFAAKSPGANAEKTYLVECVINRFDITETNYYNCSLSVTITIKNSADSVLARQKIIASARSWGRSFDEGQYSNAISNGVVQVINEILAMDIFKNDMPAKEAGDTTLKSK